MVKSKKNWIPKNLKKGALRKTLKVKEGENIPLSELKKAAEGGGKTAKRARLALAFRGMKKGKQRTS